MKEKGLTGFFESFLDKEPLFVNKSILQANYTPDSILHRDSHIKQVASILAPCLKLEKSSNLFVYGKTGTGKTLTVKYTTARIKQVALEKKIPVKIIYINCKLKKIADTEYRLIAQLAREFGKAVPATGLPTDEIYKAFFSALDNEKQMVILILDEVDQLVQKTGSDLLYNLTRINEELEKTQLSIIGISNDLNFVDTLDPRVKSSLSEEELVFPPYNAVQIQSILRQRVKDAFKQGTIVPGVIEKCAAFAAREHGDARRALELIRVAGELAERSNSRKVFIKHIDCAEEVIERDRVVDIVVTQPKQFQATLYSIITLCENSKDNILTGSVYDLYLDLCKRTGLRPLTQRRVSDVIGELDMLGIINAKVISKGRYGRTREITMAVPMTTIPKIRKLLESALMLG
ncbi:ORC1-type DNA replication protein [Candidatus Woesearchaeota archaeon]|nr:ORC1-type DNA replication protein [Candidatus Woesearchaeota archaeon]